MTLWTFVHVADIQVGSPRSYRFQPAWNENWQTARKQVVELNPDLLLIGGDLTRDGSFHDYEMTSIRDDLRSLPFDCHIIAGNMDTGNKHAFRKSAARKTRSGDLSLNVTSEQLRRFEAMVGPLQWSFMHKQVRFSGCYLAIAGSSLPEEEPMWDFLEGLSSLPPADHHIFIMHYALFMDSLDEDEFDITDPQQYNDWYFSIDQCHRRRIMDAFKAAGVDIVITAHIHRRKTDVIDGIAFMKAPGTCMSQLPGRWGDEGDATLGFLKFDVSDSGIAEKFIPLTSVSNAKSYGPGGHPPPEERDYSIAWEK